MNFPKDDTGQILQDMANAEFDFSGEYVIDFFALFDQEADADIVAKLFIARIENDEPFVKVESRKYDHGGNSSIAIELQVSKVMEVTYENITAFEKEFKKIAEKNKGYSDGWGVYMGDENEPEPEEEDSYT
ncbi:ribonuclease E inhibitor RraB [uncultured Psychrosphaera sp.]|jgi:regulator of RNase E activity RraB|uniref:ribonuclease E inhibitor RraB n=1 Tax=uncultured Psychrosphaera sp. TaxID=1403522 RepID=UPI00262F17A4|nr:ribonuclease E inhibitor RraB [uncultured Psychrosphaera sp.]